MKARCACGSKSAAAAPPQKSAAANAAASARRSVGLALPAEASQHRAAAAAHAVRAANLLGGWTVEAAGAAARHGAAGIVERSAEQVVAGSPGERSAEVEAGIGRARCRGRAQIDRLRVSRRKRDGV